MTVAALPTTITASGFDQKTIFTLLENILAVVNEMQADHATNKVSIDELIVLGTELRVDHATFKTAVDNHTTSLANFKLIYDAHTHTADGLASRTSLPDTGSPTGSPSVASAFTNTVGTGPATITAGVPTASAATLSNATALVLTKG